MIRFIEAEESSDWGSDNRKEEYLVLDKEIWKSARKYFTEHKMAELIPVLDENHHTICFVWRDGEADREIRMLRELEACPVENRFHMEHMRAKEDQDFATEYFRGLRIEESSFEFWYRIEKIMKAVTETYGAKFLCYLQPMKFGKPDMSLFEECVHHDEKRDGYTFREKSSRNDFYKNLMELFDDREGMFIDACHYSEESKAVLADVVYGDIIGDMKGSLL